MNISTYIIDDEEHAIAVLADYISRTPGLVLRGSSTDPMLALAEISAEAPELTFMDLDMPVMTGLEMAKLLGHSTKVVFTTSYREFGPEAFELGATYYLLKPISYERFLQCIQKIRDEARVKLKKQTTTPFSFFVKTDIKGKLVRILADEIIYVSADANYLQIHLENEKIRAYLTISELIEQLPKEAFCRPHRSYIVNLKHVRTVEAGQLRLSNQAVVDVGQTYREEFMHRLNATLIVSHRDRAR
jgi:DNA-binding LytR/AlgR family response regulator